MHPRRYNVIHLVCCRKAIPSHFPLSSAGTKFLAYRETETARGGAKTQGGSSFARPRPPDVKKGGNKLPGKKWVQVTARRPTGKRAERGGERASPCFALHCLALPPSLSPHLVPHLRECFFGLSRDALSSPLPPPPLRSSSLRRNPIYALEVDCVTRAAALFNAAKGRSSVAR